VTRRKVGHKRGQWHHKRGTYSYNPRRGRRHRRRRHNAMRRHHRRNPPKYGIKEVAIGVVLVGAGFAGSKLLPYAICKLTGDQSWGMGYTGLGIQAVGSLTFAALGYGIARLVGVSKRRSTEIGGALLTGGLVAVAHDGYMIYSGTPSAPPAAMTPAGVKGVGNFSPAQLAQAQRAAALLRQGTGNFNPAAFQAAHASPAPLFAGDESF